jgi:hypothetical protein
MIGYGSVPPMKFGMVCSTNEVWYGLAELSCVCFLSNEESLVCLALWISFIWFGSIDELWYGLHGSSNE